MDRNISHSDWKFTKGWFRTAGRGFRHVAITVIVLTVLYIVVSAIILRIVAVARTVTTLFARWFFAFAVIILVTLCFIAGTITSLPILYIITVAVVLVVLYIVAAAVIHLAVLCSV